MRFLKRMALLYPEYHFCGVKYALNGLTAEDLLVNNGDRFIIDKIKVLKEKSTIGGVLMMFGFIEGTDIKKVDDFDANVKHLIDKLRAAAGNETLPVIFGRYEENGRKVLPGKFHRYDDVLTRQIEALEKIDRFLKLAPIRPVPKGCFCDDHHYNDYGYHLWVDDAVALIQINKFDFWNGR